jgi:hypothetical protein
VLEGQQLDHNAVEAVVLVFVSVAVAVGLGELVARRVVGDALQGDSAAAAHQFALDQAVERVIGAGAGDAPRVGLAHLVGCLVVGQGGRVGDRGPVGLEHVALEGLHQAAQPVVEMLADMVQPVDGALITWPPWL